MFRSLLQQQQKQSLVRFQSSHIPKLSENPRLPIVFPSLKQVKPDDLYGKSYRGVYFIPRTSKGNLPVYKTIKSQAVFTEVKRIQGDITTLRNDIQKLFPEIEKSNFNCMMQSSTIRIKGDITKRLTNLLAEKF